ncbi:hypothetical protein A1O1_05894 [Capronia coronata CBS 617.96]|uniref:Uncharacterized protein n=1 Tax=Capronia coronata CBS 617.96 TaxID=1182541 RepID=W9Y7C8_9EURO|nr:uncharacterized protein A1O1_05894 [Capronia coronata CBS 617.96]EXJ85530.1 hypothetical protein A1O1_05894 [Capronia coronata CBS 617.96]
MAPIPPSRSMPDIKGLNKLSPIRALKRSLSRSPTKASPQPSHSHVRVKSKLNLRQDNKEPAANNDASAYDLHSVVQHVEKLDLHDPLPVATSPETDSALTGSEVDRDANDDDDNEEHDVAPASSELSSDGMDHRSMTNDLESSTTSPPESKIEKAYFSDPDSRLNLCTNPGDRAIHLFGRAQCSLSNYAAEIDRRIVGKSATRDFAYEPSDPMHERAYGHADGQS